MYVRISLVGISRRSVHVLNKEGTIRGFTRLTSKQYAWIQSCLNSSYGRVLIIHVRMLQYIDLPGCQGAPELYQEHTWRHGGGREGFSPHTPNSVWVRTWRGGNLGYSNRCIWMLCVHSAVRHPLGSAGLWGGGGEEGVEYMLIQAEKCVSLFIVYEKPACN